MTRCESLLKNSADNEVILISSYPNIFYYSGFTSEDARLLITKEECYLFTDSRYTIQAKAEAEGFMVKDNSEFAKIIKNINKEILCIEEESLTVSEFSALQKHGLKPKPYSKEIKGMRRVKEPDEIKKIAEAERLGDEAFLQVLKMIKPGKREDEIAAELEYFMRANGANKTSFDTICASGKRSAMPHGAASSKVIENGDFVTLDFGCVLDGYCSDMTRTVVVGKADEKQREIYSVVLEAQNTALELLADGVACREADRAAREVIKCAGYGENFTHSTGHSVGIEIHELPVLSAKSEDILTEGNVVTVEPGIYIEGFGGVRIEDVAVIKKDGYENLTSSPKELITI